MCCTFGDLTDVQWWRELQLPTRTVIGKDGRLLRDTPEWLTNAEPYEQLAGKTAFSAREAMVSLLRESGDLDGEPTPTQRKANFFEKGDKPLEIVSTRQWYIRNGGRDEALKSRLLELGNELQWVPGHMRHRYENWVSGLNGDWLVSRQRFFGVPIPVWYRLDEAGECDFSAPILAPVEMLPVDPADDVPPGYSPEQRGVPGGFIGDPDVLDTWATSSLTPQLACGWERDPELFELTFPMDLAPQSHDIIRTWLFSRVVRANYESGCLPWRRTAISGFVMDPDRKKMSKSKGNVVLPTEILERFGSDAVRWRAALARPGMDSPFDEKQMKVGRRLALKILNASKFALSNGVVTDPEALANPIDLAMLRELASVVQAATKHLDAYDYSSALETVETFFWSFCDDYLETVKERAYGAQGEAAAESAQAALTLALSVQLRLFAPYLPFATEEVWSWWHEDSVHHQSWPQASELPASGSEGLLGTLSAALSLIRGIKSDAKVSMKRELTDVVVSGPQAELDALQSIEADLRSVGRLTGEIRWRPEDGNLRVVAEIAAE